MKIRLAYGQTGLTIDLPEDRTTVIEPTYVPGVPDQQGAVRAAIRNPLGRAPLRRLARPSQSVAISVCDVTRPMPTSTVLPILLGELTQVPDEQITVLIATGTHRANTPDELETMLGPEVVGRYRVVNHSAFEADQLLDLGETPDGTPLALNRIWAESDVRITLGLVEPHFFAGFSGGPKMVAPGLAGLETVMGLHRAELIGHPSATWGVTEGNPIHDAIRHIARSTGVDFSVDVTVNRDRQITSVYAGEVFAVHRAACDVAKRMAMRAVSEPFDVVVTSNSGHPLDQNLYQAVKGMSAAAQIVRPGGSIICAAECRDGLPDHGQYKEILASEACPEALLKTINAPGYRRHDQWQVQIQAQVQLKAQVFVKSGYLAPEQVRAAHLTPVDDVGAAALDGLRRHGAGSRVCVLPEGPQTIPYMEPAAGSMS